MDDDLSDWLNELALMRRSPKTIKARGLQVAGWLRWLKLRGLTPATATRADAMTFLRRFACPETAAA